MMIQVAVDVLFKYFFNMPVKGTLEIVSHYYMVGIVFLPLGIVEMRREHIRVDLFMRLLPRQIGLMLYFLTSVFTVVYFSLLVYQTGAEAIRSTKIDEMMMGTIYVVIWPSKWFLPVGLAAVDLAVILHTLQSISNWRWFDPVHNGQE